MNFFKLFHKHLQTEPLSIETDPDAIRKELRFLGIVQGVGFRFEVYQKAKQLKCTGWVQNELDGSVLSQIQGSPWKIEKLIEHLNQIPRIQIDDIIQKEIPVQKEKDFKMRN